VDELLPRARLRAGQVDGAEQQEAQRHCVAEADDGERVELRVDAAGALGLQDESHQVLRAVLDHPPQHDRHLGLAPGGHERFQQQGLAAVELLGHQMGADPGDDVGRLALEVVLGEELVELAVRLGLDGRQQQLGLAAEPPVDGAGGEPGPPGDLLHARAVVALVREHVRGRGDQPVAGGIAGRGGGPSGIGHIAASQRGPCGGVKRSSRR
jgi:hypothetical protein